MSASAPSSSASSSSSSSSSSPSSFFSSVASSWPLLAGAALVGAGVAYLGYNYKQYSSESAAAEQKKKQKEAKKKAIESTSKTTNADSNKPKKEKKKKSTTEKSSGKSSSSSTTIVSSDRPSDSALSTKARSWIENAQTAGPILANNSSSKAFLEQIRSIAASHSVEEIASLYREETRLLLAQVLVIYHTLLAVRMSGENIPGMMSFGPKPSKAETNQWQIDHKSDMGVAWKLTQGIKQDPTSEAAGSRTMALFHLDISQRMKDAEKMSAVFNEMISMGDSLGDEESMAAFMVAPMLGRWAETRSLGERACGIQSWQEFHQLSLERPEIPDYSELYAMAADIKGPPVPLTDLRWDALDLINVATRIVKFEAPAEVPRPGPEELKEKENPIPRGSCVMHRMGAIARMIAPSPIGIPLVGPSYPDKFKLTGYAQIEQASKARAQHRETYDVTLKEHIGVGEGGDTEKWIYQGSYILEQIREPDPSNNLSVEFAVTLTFIKSESDTN